MPRISFTHCRAAAKSVRRAEFGASAIRTARPRGVSGLLRSRAPLPLMLYVAGRENRLVWTDKHGLAVIEPPTTNRGPLFGGGLHMLLLRGLDRRWDLVVFLGSGVAALALALVMLPFRALWPAAIVILLGVMLFAAATMFSLVVRATYRFHRARRQSVDVAAAESLPAGYWHLSLCHQQNPELCEDLLRQTSDRLIELVTERIHAAAGALGGRVDTVMVSETLVCLRGAVTTQRMRDTIDADAGVLHPYGERAEVVIMTAPYKAVATSRGPADRGGFFLWYVLGMAVVLLVCASNVAEVEASACAGTSCAGRPATYWDAVRWLADQAAILVSSDFAPVTTRAWLLGWLMRGAGVTGLLVLAVALRQFMLHARRPQDALSQATEDQMRPIVLILVVKHNERAAVMAAVHARNGTKPRKEFRGEDTVWALGPVGGVDVLLAQGPEQGGHGPNGMTTVAARLMITCAPDYVILTGICYGLEEDHGQRIGDVLVSQRLHDMDRQRLMGDRRVASGHYVPASGFMLSRFNAAVVDRPIQAGVHFGLMLASNTLFDSPDKREWLKQQYPEAIGGEMEGESVYSVAAARRIDWIVVKAIADWGKKKTVDYQDLATQNAAEFVIHTIASGGFTERRARPD